jgi:hypothetical protein
VESKNTLIGRRQFLIRSGVASTVALAAGAIHVSAEAAAGCQEKSGSKVIIKGIVAEKPTHEPAKWMSMPGGGMPGGAGGPGGGMPGGAGGQGGPSGTSGGQGGPGGGGAAGGGMPGGAGGAGSGGGMPGAVASATPAIYVEDSRYLADKSSTSAVAEGKVTDKYSKGAKVTAKKSDVGGVYVKGVGTEYVLADATIDLSGKGGFGLGGPNSGAASDDYSTLTIRNCTITTTGENRNATSAQNHSVLNVYNSTIKAKGEPFKPDFTTSGQKTQLEIDGNSRTHVTLSNSYSYFYYSTIIAEGWAALSTDSSEGFVYLEANDCTVKTITAGYGTYADSSCHCVLNRCNLDVAGMAAIIANEADVTFRDTKAKCGSYFGLIHNVAAATDVGTMKVYGGDITTKKAAFLFKSANVELLVDGAKVKSDIGVLLKSQVSLDSNASASVHPKGQKIYGIHATLKDMDVTGDILHDDKENRLMTVYLQATTLKGAIHDVRLSMNRLSKWIATADSTVTLVGDVELAQIDAVAGVTITATAASGGGTYKLASCGTLIVKTA